MGIDFEMLLYRCTPWKCLRQRNVSHCACIKIYVWESRQLIACSGFINAEPAFCYLLRKSTPHICYTVSGNNKKFIHPLNSHLIEWLSDIFFLLPRFQFSFTFSGFIHCLSLLLFLLMAYFLLVTI